MSDLLPDGIYFNLEPEEYFLQGLGSTDLVKLWANREGWWWSSHFNPDRAPDPKSADRTYGSALHALMLEGIDAYEARFVARPSESDFVGLVKSTDEIKAALDKAGLNVRSGTSGWKKEHWNAAMAAHLPDTPCWDNIIADIETHQAGREFVSSAEDRAIRFMAQVATDPSRTDNAEIRHLFEMDGARPPLAEISIIKTLPDGVRRRWRIDRMFPSFNLDLKSLRGLPGARLSWTVGDEIAKRSYDVQRLDYHEGRLAAYEMIADGFKVHGGTIEQRNFLREFPTIAPTFDFVWIFYEKPNHSAGQAPVIFPVMDITRDRATGHPSILMQSGAAKKAQALATYRRCMAEFGPDRPWARVDGLHYVDEAFEPRVFIPHWIADVGAIPDTREETA